MQTVLRGNRSVSKSRKAVEVSYLRGYRVTEKGIFLNPKGKELPIKLRSNHKYPQTTISVNNERLNLNIHRLASYCFYGDKMFEEGICVRHLNGNVLDVSKDNIALGTYSENERDKCPKIRSKNASNAVKMRKDTRRLTMRRFSDEEVRKIRRKSGRGIKGVDIAKEYGVVKDTIYQILRGETYKDV